MGCLLQKKENDDKKNQNFGDVLEDIMDIKAVQIKGEMLFSRTQGQVSDHYEIPEKAPSNGMTSIIQVTNKFSKAVRAMKTIKRSFIDLQEDEKNFMKEIALLRIVDHMSVLKIYEFYQDQANFFLIMEYCKGDLFDKIHKEAPFNEHTACHITYQLLSALFYCHSHDIIHRDIKAESILIESSEEVNFQGETFPIYNIRLSDFSSARKVGKKKKLTKKIGTSYYIAPEVLKRSYNEKCDIWSVGVLLFILLSGHPPFWGSNDKEILDKVANKPPDFREDEWEKVSPEGRRFVELLLEKQPGNRPSAGEAIKNEWFKKKMFKHEVSKELVQDIYTNIISFKNDSKMFFQAASIAYMVHHLAKDKDISEIKKFYVAIDNNADGNIYILYNI